MPQVRCVAEETRDVGGIVTTTRRGKGQLFTLFVLAGACSAALNALSRVIFSSFVSFEIAVILAYVVGMVSAFLLFKLLVFEASRTPLTMQWVRFSLVNIVSLLQVWLISVFLVRVLMPSIAFQWHSEFVAHAIGLLSLTITSYILHKHFTFGRGSGDPAGGSVTICR